MPGIPQKSTIPPKHAQVLVIGGGPAGAYAASALAREGIQAVVLEAAHFPRYHIGESLIPSVRHYLRYIGMEETMMEYGFIHKPGAAIKFTQHKREGYTDFVGVGLNNSSWNVIRSEFDKLLLDHAHDCGASVYESTRVDAISFSETQPDKPVSATWTHSANGSVIAGETMFDYLVDASGRAGIISTKYMNNRHFNESLRNIAIWAYWRDVGTYGVGTSREGAPWFEALVDQTGWAWFIPLHNGQTSIGVVMNQKASSEKAREPLRSPFTLGATPNLSDSSTTVRYLNALGCAPGLVDLITSQGVMVSGVQSTSDFSYSASAYGGPNFRIVGDAGAFIDPFFSSGVHLAMTSALSAAATICASIRGDCTETIAAKWHMQRFATSYTRFQLVVVSAYKQIRSESPHVLSDFSEDNFDRAFTALRPVIQGGADVGARLSEDEIQKSLDFCINLFNPTSPEQHDREEKAMADKRLLAANAPDKEERTMVLKKLNARRVVHAEYNINNLEVESIEGLAVRLVKGKLGLTRVD
ncbi:FAD/NAD(P)-binding domain-containing protein [Fistulina hepatica ATCC 64428]|uniref:FAD/NAD(P)-binding domain-containing protein n=1 Tax=Fistulina hepatica ATCC 64428 TaxID=1128425 RepID=A0A0D7AHI9_9AGAR|nr:FAD/NAD(P)-binding domain-containing protein [Fistulina hepatica ATCC 64428]